MKVLRQSTPISPEQQVEYFSQHIWPSMDVPRPANILISLFKNGFLIGYGGLVHIAWEHKRAELSFLLATERLQDLAIYAEDFSAFLGLIKRIVFEDLKLHRIFTETYDILPHHISIYRPQGIFDYVYAADAAEGLIRLAEHEQTTGIINLGTGKARRVQEVVDVLRKHFPEMVAQEIDSNIPYEASEADMSLYQAQIG